VLSKPFVDDNGYLNIAVKNNSAVTVSNIQVQLTEMQNAFVAGASQTIGVKQALTPGQQISVKTNIGPLKETNNYRSLVTRVSQPK